MWTKTKLFKFLTMLILLFSIIGILVFFIGMSPEIELTDNERFTNVLPFAVIALFSAVFGAFSGLKYLFSKNKSSSQGEL